MDVELVGLIATWSAAAACLISVVTGRRRVLWLAGLATLVAVVTLAVALLVGDFSLAYVAETTSAATPWPYRLAALWGGMDGSMLFYSTLTIVVGAVATSGKTAIRAVATVGLGLLLITLFFANPFQTLDIPAVDGLGLLAILQHPAMVYHPPILYLGLTSLVVPFALLLERGDQVDMARVKIWVYRSWVLLTVGMAAGANWAYAELGWGGFWAWDPVENTALMPWLALTALIHVSMTSEATGKLRRATAMLTGMPFALSVAGVYLTRSGATGSIHSFAEDPVVGRALFIGAAAALVVTVVRAMRMPRGEPWGTVRLNRDFWLAANGILTVTTLVFVTAGSAYPAAIKAFNGDTVVVDSRFFIVTILPVAILIAIGSALSLATRWSLYMACSLVAALIVLVVAGRGPGAALMTVAISAVVVLVVALVTGRVARRQVVAHLAHLGLAVMLIGVAGSSYGEDFSGSMVPGDVIEVGGHRVELVEVVTGEAGRYVYARGSFRVDGAMVTPEIRGYEQQALPVAEPALRSTIGGDVIVAMSLLFPDGQTVDVSVFARPLVLWVWVGSALMALAGLIAIAWRGEVSAGLRRRARVERQPGGRATDIAAR